MITIFNRVEIACTLELERQAYIRQILSQNGIEYKLKVTDLRNASMFPSQKRTRGGSFRESAQLQYEYQFYVKKQDKDQALYLINKK